MHVAMKSLFCTVAEMFALFNVYNLYVTTPNSDQYFISVKDSVKIIPYAWFSTFMYDFLFFDKGILANVHAILSMYLM